jgi:hypothetical protein
MTDVKVWQSMMSNYATRGVFRTVIQSVRVWQYGGKLPGICSMRSKLRRAACVVTTICLLS